MFVTEPNISKFNKQNKLLEHVMLIGFHRAEHVFLSGQQDTKC